MKTFVVATFALLLLTGAAFSQQGREAGENANTLADKQDADDYRAAQEEKKQKELDSQYKAALGRVKTPVAPPDPWADVRSAKTPAAGH